jgi:HK97 family phage major capsid protein
MTRTVGLIDHLNYLLHRGVPAPDSQVGAMQERFARENEAAGIQAYESPGPSMYVPLSVLNQRDLSVAAQGGAVVQTSIVPPITEFLQPFSAVIRLGGQVVDGLKGNASFPIGRASVSTSWTAETGPALEGDGAVGSFSLTPHLISAQLTVSRQLLVQSPGFEAYLRRELASALATELDRQAILGSGSSGQPTGILSATGTQPITFGAAASWSKIVQFEQLAGLANARTENLAWVIGNNSRAKWRQALKAGSGAVGFIYEDHTVNTFPVAVTSKLDPTGQVILGDFQEVFLGFWGSDALHLTVDGITAAKVGKVILTANLWADVSLRRSNLFIVSQDSGAQ